MSILDCMVVKFFAVASLSEMHIENEARWQNEIFKKLRGGGGGGYLAYLY